MSAATELIGELEGRGVEITVNGDKLRWRAPPGAMTAEIKANLKAHKGEVIDFLTGALAPGARPPRTAVTEAPVTDAASAHRGTDDVWARGKDSRTEVWDSETASVIEWFLASTPPATPFELQRGVTIAHPSRYWAYLRGDIAAGPGKGRSYYGAFEANLRRLYELFGPGQHRSGARG